MFYFLSLVAESVNPDSGPSIDPLAAGALGQQEKVFSPLAVAGVKQA